MHNLLFPPGFTKNGEFAFCKQNTFYLDEYLLSLGFLVYFNSKSVVLFFHVRSTYYFSFISVLTYSIFSLLFKMFSVNFAALFILGSFLTFPNSLTFFAARILLYLLHFR